MIVYRLTKGKYKNKLSGKGAELYGGRWNSKGKQMIYTAENRALCTAEIAVHTPLGIIPSNYFLQTIQLPKTKYKEVNIKNLPKDWKEFPHPKSTKSTGDNFLLENKYLFLKTPSSIVQDEYNYLINPDNINFKKVKIIKIEEFKFDKRLFLKK